MFEDRKFSYIIFLNSLMELPIARQNPVLIGMYVLSGLIPFLSGWLGLTPRHFCLDVFSSFL